MEQGGLSRRLLSHPADHSRSAPARRARRGRRGVHRGGGPHADHPRLAGLGRAAAMRRRIAAAVPRREPAGEMAQRGAFRIRLSRHRRPGAGDRARPHQRPMPALRDPGS